jgi:hypothetical protein
MNKRTQWEYKEETLHFKGAKQRLLNDLGKEGWELCGIMNDSHATAYFKRPIIKSSIVTIPGKCKPSKK